MEPLLHQYMGKKSADPRSAVFCKSEYLLRFWQPPILVWSVLHNLFRPQPLLFCSLALALKKLIFRDKF